MNFCEKKPRATKCSDHHTFSFVANTAMIVARILKRIIGRILRIHVEKTSLDLESKRMLRMISQ
jgi:hypothetical protein